jgi:hypothetical protein
MSNFRTANVFVQTQMHSFIALVKEKRILLFISMTSVVVITLFLYEAEPYDISLWHDEYKILKLSGYAFIYAGTICAYFLLISPSIFYPVALNFHTLSRISGLFCLIMVTIGVFDWLYTDCVNYEYPADIRSLLKSIKHVFIFSLVFFLYYMLHLLQRHRKYKLKPVEQKTETLITFDKFSVLLTDIMLIKSDENYIFLHYMLEGFPKKIQLRYKISDAEEQLSAYNQFVRVQKSYLVNMLYVNRENFDRNPKLLRIEGIDERIIIGKTFKRNLKKWQELVY